MRLGHGARLGHGLTLGGTLSRRVDLVGISEWEMPSVAQLGILRSLAGSSQVAIISVAELSTDQPGLLIGVSTWTVAGEAALQVARELSGTSEVEVSSTAVLQVVRELVATGVIALESAGVLSTAPLDLGPVRFYLTTARGVVPVVGGLPAFSRASSAEMEDPNGRTLEALPNTPQSTWQSVLGNLKRAVLRLQPAHLTAGGLQAVDLLYYLQAPPPDADATYLCIRIDWDPGDAGHLLWLSDLTGAAPRLRVRHAGDSFFAELHNGAASAEVEVEAAHTAGQIAELLVVTDPDADVLELIVALDGVVAGSTSLPLPSGGLPGDWSDNRVVLNGYNQHPTSAGYAEVRTLSLELLEEAGDDRLAEAREYVLSPAGEVI